MCTLVLAASAVPGCSLLVVANRDEMLDRPSTAPFAWPEGFVAPRDDKAGGTWLGLNRHGLFAAVTNRFNGPKDEARRSRGELVKEALAAPTARAAHDRMAALRPDAYNGFHLVYADGRDVLATISDGHTLAQLSLGPGLHAVTERSFGAGDDHGRRERIGRAFPRLSRGGPDALTRLLSEHDPADPLAATCIHLEGLRYGTRSAMVLAVPEDGGPPRMLWAEGPPCTAPFAEVDLGPVLARGVSGPAETG